MREQRHSHKRYLRIGKFQVAREIIHKAVNEEDQGSLEQLKPLFREFIIINAEYKPLEQVIEFTAYSPKFQPIECTEMLMRIPRYVIEFEETIDKEGKKHYKIINIRGEDNEI